MNLPKSLFWRLTALLLVALFIAFMAQTLLFRQEREALITRNFTEAKIQQINAIRASLERNPIDDGEDTAQTLEDLGEQYGVILLREERKAVPGEEPKSPALLRLIDKLRERLGTTTEVRLGLLDDRPVVWIHFPTLDGSGVAPGKGPETVWAGIPIRTIESAEVPLRLIGSLMLVLALLLAGTYIFARLLARPLSGLADAVSDVADGKHPDRLPENGPSEIARVARNVNQMAANLARLERDRRTMLAGVSHDIRTPLTRLRLASELSIADPVSRAEVAADIDEIDRVVRQFLDFARGTPKDAPVEIELRGALSSIANLAAARSQPVVFVDAEGPPVRMDAYPAALERMLMNLIENAHRYGKSPVLLSLKVADDHVEIDMRDSGPGVLTEDVERLKQPFVRGDHARGGPMGAGLGLAIVEQLAQWHNGSFDLLTPAGGGTIARLKLARRLPASHTSDAEST